ncbi:MAG: dihydroorotase, partial [candidate division NC10 bacterium]|nr:dihydroorotase [candidate division NC10 bacterium]
MRILIEGGRVIDPANKVDAVLDLWIEDGRIAALGPQPPVRNAPPPDRV